MKKYNFLVAFMLFVLGFSACQLEDYSTMEFYKQMVSLLSKENYNIYTDVFPYDDGQPVKQYFSITVSGSQPNPDAFTVELEHDTILFNQYNRSNFDIDTSKYAILLDESRFTIDSYKVEFPANNPDPYVTVGMSVIPDGLSPDSTYFVPISIKNVSRYEVNPDKFNMLFRVAMENYYAEQINVTYYQQKGYKLNDKGEMTSSLNGTKIFAPLSKNSVRVYVGGEIQTSKSTLEEIKDKAMVITVGDDNKVTLRGYGTTQVELIEDAESNYYEEVRKNAVDNTMIKNFVLHYRYRTLKKAATKDTPAEYNSWQYISETLKRLEI